MENPSPKLHPQPQPQEEEEEMVLLTQSKPFQRMFETNPSHLSKKLQMRQGAKRKGPSPTKLTGPERSTGTKKFKRRITDKSMFDGRSEVRISAIMKRAGEVQSSLDPKFPSFFKLMLRSHVALGFQMNFPHNFCRLHLPKSDTTIILEGEDGVEYKTKYLSEVHEKVGLSAGWKDFSLAHELHKGDIVVFHLILPTKFKVYIVRANELAKVDGAQTPVQLDDSTSATDFACNEKPIKRGEHKNESHLMPLFPDIYREIPEVNDKMAVNELAKVDGAQTPVQLDNSTSPTDFACNEKPIKRGEHKNESHQKPLFPDIYREMPEVNDKMAVNSYLAPKADECANSRAIATSVISEDFKIIFNGSIIDSELSTHHQARYYKLCCSRNSYLHVHLKAINQKLAAGIISETMDIADAIRASNHSTSLNDYRAWDKTLEAFEMWGMDVGFLRARLNRLMGLELKLLELKQTSHGLQKEMESVKEETARYKIMFQEEASAAW